MMTAKPSSLALTNTTGFRSLDQYVENVLTENLKDGDTLAKLALQKNHQYFPAHVVPHVLADLRKLFSPTPADWVSIGQTIDDLLDLPIAKSHYPFERELLDYAVSGDYAELGDEINPGFLSKVAAPVLRLAIAHMIDDEKGEYNFCNLYTTQGFWHAAAAERTGPYPTWGQVYGVLDNINRTCIKIDPSELGAFDPLHALEMGRGSWQHNQAEGEIPDYEADIINLASFAYDPDENSLVDQYEASDCLINLGCYDQDGDLPAAETVVEPYQRLAASMLAQELLGKAIKDDEKVKWNKFRPWME